MMMYTPSMLYEMGKAREREMLEAEEKERLTRLAMSEQPSRLSGLVSGIRGRLSSSLQRSVPAPVQETVPCSG